MTRNTGINTIYIIGICLLTNMPVTLHIYVPLHYNYCLHIDPPLPHKKKNNTLLYLFTMLWIYMPAWNMTFKYQMFNTCANYFPCLKRGNMATYMPHMKSLTSTMWSCVRNTDNKRCWHQTMTTQPNCVACIELTGPNHPKTLWFVPKCILHNTNQANPVTSMTDINK